MRRICAILRHKDIGGVRRDALYRLSISRFFVFHASTPPPRGSVDSSLERLGSAVFTLRPDAFCYESKFRLGLRFRNYISEQKGSGCWGSLAVLWRSFMSLCIPTALPRYLFFGYYVEPFFLCHRILLWDELQLGTSCVLISKLLHKSKYVCIFYLLVINKLSSFGM